MTRFGLGQNQLNYAACVYSSQQNKYHDTTFIASQETWCMDFIHRCYKKWY